MAFTTADKVADFILCFFSEKNDSVTNLKLQKLVYYTQAWFLAIHDQPLFEERFEAWVHGPVQPELYHRFKRFRWDPILDLPTCPKFPKKVRNHIEEVMKVYGELAAYDLERIVHREDPWKKARGGISPDAVCTNVIEIEEMKSFYGQMATA